jgi:cytochrome P450 family 4
MNKLSFAYGRMPWLWIEPIWRLTGYKAEYEKNLKLVTDFTRQVIETRREDFLMESDENRHKKCAFLDLLLGMQKEGDLTDADVRDEVETFMFEGHDTTASGMAWTLWCLAHHPEYQKRVIEEVDSLFG